MKKIVVILCMLLAAAGAYGQNHHHSHDFHHHRTEKVHKEKHHRSQKSHGTKSRNHGSKHYKIPDEVECLNEWQELWNGCHVRIKFDRVSVVNRNGDTVVRGDRVILTSNGKYEVKVGDIWRVYDRNGVSTSLSGWDVFYWPEGFYGIKVGDFWRLYYENGDMVGNVWGERIDIIRNNLIRCTRNGTYYYYDFQGNERR